MTRAAAGLILTAEPTLAMILRASDDSRCWAGRKNKVEGRRLLKTRSRSLC